MRFKLVEYELMRVTLQESERFELSKGLSLYWQLQ